MADKSGAGKGLYFIVGALVVVVAIMAFFLLQKNDEPDLSIDFSDGIEIETN